MPWLHMRDKSEAAVELMEIYRKIDIRGNTKRPLTPKEQILIFRLAKMAEEEQGE